MDYPVNMVAGDSITIEIAVPDEDGDGAFDLTPLVAASWWMAPDARTASADVPLKKTLGDGIAVKGAPAAGILAVTLDPADTQDIAPAGYYHEAEIRLEDGTVKTVYTGAMRIRPGLIKS